MSSIKFSQLQSLTSPPVDTVFPVVSSGSNYKLALSSIKTAVIPSWSEVTGKPNFNSVAFSGLYADLSGKPTIPVIPTLVSAFTNDRGYLTTVDYGIITNAPQLSAVATSGNWLDIVNKPAWFNTTTPGYLYSDGSGTLSFQNVIDTSGGVSTATVKALIANSLSNFVSGVSTATVTALIANSLTNFVNGVTTATVTSLIANSLSNFVSGVTTATVTTLIANSLTNKLATVARTGNWTDVVNKPAWFSTTATGYLYSDGTGTLGFQSVQGPIGNTGTIWTNDANGCLRVELSSTGFQAFTDASHLDLQDSGEWNIGSYQNSTFIGNDQFTNTNILSLKSGDETYITTNLRENGNHQWKFGTDGSLTFPSGAQIIADSQDGTYLQANPGIDGYAGLSSLTGNSWMWTANDGGAYISSSDGATVKSWSFNTDGKLTLPIGGDIVDSNGDSVLGGGGGGGSSPTDRITTGSYSLILGADGVLTMPGSITSLDGQSVVMFASSGTAAIVSNYSGGNQLFVQDDGAYVQTSEVVTTNNTIGSNGSQFYTDIDIGNGFGVIDGWHQRNPQQIEVNIFTAQAPIWSVLIGASLGATVIVTYSTLSGNQTFTSVLSQQFTGQGQYDPGHDHGQRYSGRIDGTLPAGQTGIVSINFPTYTTNYNNWTFGTDGNLTFANGTSIGSLEGSAGIFGPNGTDFLINTRFDNTGVYQAWTFGTDGNLTVPGDIVLPYGTIGSGTGDGIKLTTDRGTILFGNSPEICGPTGSSHFHIMKQDPTLVDLFFGDDFNNLKLPTTGGVSLQAFNTQTTISSTWTFDGDGLLTLPSGNTRIGSLDGGGSDSILASTGTIFGIIAQGAMGTAGLQWIEDISSIGSTSTRTAGIAVNPFGGTTGTVQIVTGVTTGTGVSNTWEFRPDGTLTLPGSDPESSYGGPGVIDYTTSSSLRIGGQQTGEGFRQYNIRHAIAIGNGAQDSASTAGNYSIAIGSGDDTGWRAKDYSICIGTGAGYNDGAPVGFHSIAIGHKANYLTGHDNSITLNATGDELNINASGFYVKPVREDIGNTTKAVYYNTTTGELTYANPTGGLIQSATAPATTSTSTIWYDTVSGRSYIYYDGNWVDASPTQIPSPETYLDGLAIDGTVISTANIDNNAIVIDGGDNTKLSVSNLSVTIQVPGSGVIRPYWAAEFGGITTAITTSSYTVGTGAFYDSVGNVYVLGAVAYGNFGFNNTDSLLLKYDTNGNLLWSRTWHDNSGNNCGAVNQAFAIDSNDRIYWLATDAISGGCWTGYMDTDGNLGLGGIAQGSLGFNNAGVSVVDIACDNSGNYYLAGSHYGDGTTPVVIKVDGNSGAPIWTGRIIPEDYEDLPADGQYRAVTVNPATGDVWAIGDYIDTGNLLAMLSKWDVNGVHQWTKKLVTSSGDLASAVIYNGGYVYTIVNDDGSQEAIVSKFDTDGDLIWASYLATGALDPITNGDPFTTSGAYDLSFDATGNVYVTGTIPGPPAGQPQLWITKLDPANGEMLYSRILITDAGVVVIDQGEFGGSSSGHRVGDIYQDKIAVTAVTSSDIDDSTGTNEIRVMVAQLPIDGSVTGTFGNITIGDLTSDIDSICSTGTYTVTTLVWSTGTSTAIYSTSSISVSYVTDIVGLTGETLALGSVSGSSTVTNTWTFVNNNIILPPGGDILDSNGVSVLGATTSTIALPSWITVVPGTNHLPTLNTDYGWNSLGAWSTNATILDAEEGTSYPFRTTFSIPNDTKSVTTVDFVVADFGADFGIGVFAAGTNPVWLWDAPDGNLSANRIGAQYNGSNPELHGISGGDDNDYDLPGNGTYRARLTVDPTGPGTADITLETLDTSNNVLDTISYTETEFFGTDYKIGFASDQDDGTPRTYFKNLTINVNNGATVYTDTLMNGSSTGGTTTALGDRLTAGSSSVVLGTDGALTLPEGGIISNGMGAIRLDPAGSGSTQALLIYPTTQDGNHIHLTAGGGTTDLYLGNDDQFVKIDHSGTVVVQTYSTATTSTWTFGTDGVLTLSTASTILGAGTDPNVYIETATTATTSTWTFGTNGILTLPAATPVIRGGGTGTDVTVIATTGSNTATWVFGATGGLTFPDSTVQTTAYTGGVSSVSTSTLVNGTYTVSLSTTGQLNLPGAANTESNNARIQSANSIDVLSNLSLWTFGTDGVLTIPADGEIKGGPGGVNSIDLSWELILNSGKTIKINPGASGVVSPTYWSFNSDISGGGIGLPAGSTFDDRVSGVLIGGAGETRVNRFYAKVSNTLYETVDADTGITYRLINQAGTWSLDVVGDSNPRYTSSDLITWTGGEAPAPTGEISTRATELSVGTGNTWAFGADSNLTFPNNSKFDGQTLTDHSSSTNYTLKIANGGGAGSVFGIGTGDDTYGIANDALNHALNGYVPYTVTAQRIDLTVPGGGTWTFGTDGSTSLASGVEISNSSDLNFVTWNTGSALILADTVENAPSLIYIPSSSDTVSRVSIANTNTTGGVILVQGPGDSQSSLEVNSSGVFISTVVNNFQTGAWQFSSTGTLKFPDNTQQITAYTGTVAYSNITGAPTPTYTSTYTGWFKAAGTVVQLDTLLARINSTGTMQISSTIVETIGQGSAFAWNGVRNKGATMSSFGQGGTNWVMPGDWLDISATPLDNDFEVATVSVFKLGGTGSLYRITYVGATNNKWSVNIERVAQG